MSGYGGPERRRGDRPLAIGLRLVPAIEHPILTEEARTRAAQRAAALPRRMLTAETLAHRLGLTLSEAEHMIQPWCECYIGEDGWHHCQHWRDERGRTRR